MSTGLAIAMPKTSRLQDQEKKRVMYSEILRDHAVKPRNRREMEKPDAVGSAYYRRCRDKVTMFFRIQENAIQEVTFTARGCGPAVAAASMASTMLQGRTVDEARQLTAFQLHEALGGLPPSKRHALLLVLECLTEALGSRDYKF